ncbi:phage tail tape measure protein [Altererythrobacter sp. ZODW24]|uniref:phage tail tape measure protein n=1 Tax=Altererythrobacter sp. ZODW24 TaxID=2185142 RepID=UPI000DF7C6C1|nr:phage tail tape measure protein [Altererythrobacter sp. ZODW24]
MDDPIDELLIDVRANTRGFAADLTEMRGTFDSTLLGGFEKAGNVLESGLLSALRKGSIGFEDLKRVALSAMNQIASQAINSGLGSIFGSTGGLAVGGAQTGGIAGLLGGLASSVLGLPGRATGGPVSPGRGYLVGERGPEMFVPTSAGRVEANGGGANGQARDVRVSISVPRPRGTDTPVAMQRSSRQVASAVRRALREF